MIYNDEHPRSAWNEQLYLAERLQPSPRLIPSNFDDQVTMFGLCNQLCGENGLGWSRRLLLIKEVATDPNSDENARKGILAFGARYGYSHEAAEAAPARISQIVAAFSARLESQRVRGSRFLIGDQLSALDIYWAVFAALLRPLPNELCPISSDLRRRYRYDDAGVQEAAAQLFAHRDFIYREYLELPVNL
jgi:glutathione S-transferase